MEFPKLNAQILYVSKKGLTKMIDPIKKHNLFAAYYRENSFYLNKAKELYDRTVIEIYRKGNLDEIILDCQVIADILEKCVLISSILVIRRKEYQKIMGIQTKLGAEFYFAISKNYRYLRTKSVSVPEVAGLTLDKRFYNRFFKCGFEDLAVFCMQNTKISSRVKAAINWLIESRQDVTLSAAIVKTSIALESLLIFDKSEPLSKSLSERAAFLLSPDANVRKNISKIIKQFYNERSKVVHGSSSSVHINMIESVDRLIVLLCLIISNNKNQFRNQENIQNWCEDIKWGQRKFEIILPFPNTYLKNALKLFYK